MTLPTKPSIHDLKRQYKNAINQIITESVSDDGVIDLDHARAAIAHLWFHQFMIDHVDLDIISINEVWSVFDDMIFDLDRCEYTNDCAYTPKVMHNSAFY